MQLEPITIIALSTNVAGDKVYVGDVAFTRDMKFIPYFTSDPTHARDFQGPQAVTSFLEQLANYPGYEYKQEYINV